MGCRFAHNSAIDPDIPVHCIPCVHHQPDRQQPNESYDTLHPCKRSTSSRYYYISHDDIMND